MRRREHVRHSDVRRCCLLLQSENNNGADRLNGTKFYSTGSIYSDYTQVWASAPGNRIAGAVVPIDRAGVSILDDWDGFGQRLTGTGTRQTNKMIAASTPVVIATRQGFMSGNLPRRYRFLPSR